MGGDGPRPYGSFLQSPIGFYLQGRGGIIVDGIRLDRDASRRVMREAYTIAKSAGRWRRWRPVLLALGVVLVVAALASGLTALVIYRFGGTLVRPLALILGAFIAPPTGAFAAAIAMRWSLRRLNRREIRLAMQTLGYELCTQCGYWLKGLGEDVGACPECGKRRES